MKIISNGDKLSVFVINNKDIDLNNLDMYMKELIIKLRRKYRKDIYGFYKVDVYIKDKIGMIIDFNLEEEIDFFRDLVDLKVVVHEDADVFLKFSDYFLFDKKKVYFFFFVYYVDIFDFSVLISRSIDRNDNNAKKNKRTPPKKTEYTNKK